MSQKELSASDDFWFGAIESLGEVDEFGLVLLFAYLLVIIVRVVMKAGNVS